jgi:DNA (cytosine-5)-methyltransferase 1
MFRVVREVAPGLVFAENVSEAPIQQAKQDLEASGYSCSYKRLAAKDLGADHIRPRYWLLAHANHNGELLCPVNAEAQGVPELQNGVWKTYPGELGMVDGVASRMDRLKAVGNGQVPIVAAAAFILLMGEAYNDSLPRFGN